MNKYNFEFHLWGILLTKTLSFLVTMLLNKVSIFGGEISKGLRMKPQWPYLFDIDHFYYRVSLITEVICIGRLSVSWFSNLL